jgi:hypothetical protein
VPGTFTYTSAAGSVLGAGANQTVQVTFTASNTALYGPVQTTATVNVAMAKPHVSVNPVNTTYGAPLSSSQLSGTASYVVNSSTVAVAGIFSYSSAAGSVLTAGIHTESVTFAPTDSTDYAATTSNMTVTVAKAGPQATADPLNITYGFDFDDSHLTGTAAYVVNGQTVNVPGAFTIPGDPDNVLPVGTNNVTVTFNPGNNNYIAVTTSMTVNVSQATPKVTVNAVKLTYGTALNDSQLSGTATYEVNDSTVTVGGVFTYASAAGSVLTAGKHTESVVFTPTDSADYEAVISNATVDVAKAIPVASANPIHIAYGFDIDSNLSGTASYVVNGQTVDVGGVFTLSGDPDTVLPAGQNIVSVMFTPADTTDYEAVTTSMAVNVSQATPKVTVDSVKLTYGTALNDSQLSGKASYVVEDSRVAVAGVFTYTSAAGSVLTAGQQVVSVTFTPTDSIDYAAVTTTVTVNVAQATTQVTVNAVNITYGTALNDSQLRGSATYTVNGQTVTVAGTFTYTSAGSSVLAGGTHTESVTFTPADNIDYEAITAKMTVNVAQATPQVTVNAVNITSGAALKNSQLSGTATFTVNGQSVTVVGTYTYTSATGTVLGVGANQIEQVTFTPNNSADYNSVQTTVIVNVGVPYGK